MAEEGAAPQPPENHGAWSKITSSTMMRARNQSSEMLTRLQQYEAAEAASKAAALEAAEREKEAIRTAARKRVKCHEVVIEASVKSQQDIDEAMQVMEGVANRLKQERYLRFADHQVNVRRSELRDGRPMPEAFKDKLQDCLDKEKEVLATSRKELLDREAEVKKFHEELAALRAQLSQDTGIRRLKVEHEMQLLKPSLAPSGPERGGHANNNNSSNNNDAAATSSTSLPPIAGAEPPESPKAKAPLAEKKKSSTNVGDPPAEKQESTNNVAEAEAPPAEKQKSGNNVQNIDLPLSGPEAMQYNTQCTQLLAKVDTFVQKSDDAIARSRREAKVATTAVTKALARRTIDLADLKRKLEQHISDVQYAITQAERSLEKQAKRLDPNDAVKKQKFEETKELRDKLNVTKATLVQDLRCKIEALNIDNSCRRVTPQVASEIRPSSATNKKKGGSGKMRNSNSEPNLTSNPNDNTTEAPFDNTGSRTPSSSKTLKAAGQSVAAG